MKIIIIASALLLASCTNVSGTRRALVAMGFTQIETHGYAVFGCGKDDLTCTKFTAVSPNGATVKGVVGCGWFKNCTVRF
jgi:hypothetical protein